MELLSALNLPSYDVPLISMANLTVEPTCEMEETRKGCGVVPVNAVEFGLQLAVVFRDDQDHA